MSGNDRGQTSGRAAQLDFASGGSDSKVWDGSHLGAGFPTRGAGHGRLLPSSPDSPPDPDTDSDFEGCIC